MTFEEKNRVLLMRKNGWTARGIHKYMPAIPLADIEQVCGIQYGDAAYDPRGEDIEKPQKRAASGRRRIAP